MKKNTMFHAVELFMGTFINVIIGLATTPIITRLVSPDSYGQISVFNLYENVIVMVFCLGLDQALIRFFYREDSLEYKKNLIRQCVWVPCLMMLVAGGVALVLCFNNLLSFEFGLSGMILLVVCAFVQLIRRFSFIVLRLEYRSRTYSVLHIIQKIIYVACVICLLQFVRDCDFEVLVWGTIISFLAVTVASILSTNKLWSLARRPRKVIVGKELFSFGLPFVFSMGLTTIFQAIDQLSIKHFCDFYETGIYSSAMSIIHICTLVQTTFNALWGPLSTKHYQNNYDSNKQFYVKANDYVCVIMFFIGIALILFKDVLVFLLGSEYRLAVYIIPCLIFNPLMQTISETTSVGINFSKKSYLHIIVSLIACVVNLIGNIWLVPVLGGRGAAISTGASYIIFFALRTWFSSRLFKITFKYGKIAIMSVVLMLYALYNTFFSNIAITVFGGVLCLSIWFCVYRRELIETIKEVMALIKKKRTANE